MTVKSLEPRVAKISLPPRPFAPQESFDFDPGLGRAVMDITFHGLAEGRTIVGAFAADKTLLHAVVVSVKKPRRLIYNLHVLRDAIRPKNGSVERTLGELSAMLKSVEKIYLNQANIILQKGSENILKVGTDLRDPFDPGAKNGRPEKDNHDLVVEALEKGDFIGLDNLNVISTWNIKDESEERQVVGTTEKGDRVTYVEKIDGAIKETSTIAHEMGHALGLGHNSIGGTMMLQASGGAPSFQLLREEIDFINRSASEKLILPP